MFVFAGPLDTGQVEHIGNQVPVPSHLWKVIYDPSAGEAITYIIDHKPLYTRDLDKYLRSVDEAEAQAGIVYFNAQHCADEGMAFLIPGGDYPSRTREAQYALKQVTYEESLEMLKSRD